MDKKEENDEGVTDEKEESEKNDCEKIKNVTEEINGVDEIDDEEGMQDKDTYENGEIESEDEVKKLLYQHDSVSSGDY